MRVQRVLRQADDVITIERVDLQIGDTTKLQDWSTIDRCGQCVRAGACDRDAVVTVGTDHIRIGTVVNGNAFDASESDCCASVPAKFDVIEPLSFAAPDCTAT